MRKHPRLKNYNYSSNGAYFITFCVKDRHKMLGRMVISNITDAPVVELSEYGSITERFIKLIEQHYDGITVDKFVVMTNHVHMIIVINRDNGASRSDLGHGASRSDVGHGASRSPRPTDALIPNVMKALKKMTNAEFGFKMWQDSYYDHIIRDETEYRRIWKYIDENPARTARMNIADKRTKVAESCIACN